MPCWSIRARTASFRSSINTNSRCSRPMCGVAAGLSRPSKHLIRLAFIMRSSPHNVGHHESRFPSLGITLDLDHQSHLNHRLSRWDDVSAARATPVASVVRFWHKADIPAAPAFVRFWVYSGHWLGLALHGSVANDPTEI